MLFPPMAVKVVNFPITVPACGYCWQYNVAGSCKYFDNEGGTPYCNLNFDQKTSKYGVLKDPKCAALEEVIK
jgi:hypothetical protein